MTTTQYQYESPLIKNKNFMTAVLLNEQIDKIVMKPRTIIVDEKNIWFLKEIKDGKLFYISLINNSKFKLNPSLITHTVSKKEPKIDTLKQIELLNELSNKVMNNNFIKNFYTEHIKKNIDHFKNILNTQNTRKNGEMIFNEVFEKIKEYGYELNTSNFEKVLKMSILAELFYFKSVLNDNKKKYIHFEAIKKYNKNNKLIYEFFTTNKFHTINFHNNKINNFSKIQIKLNNDNTFFICAINEKKNDNKYNSRDYVEEDDKFKKIQLVLNEIYCTYFINVDLKYFISFINKIREYLNL